MKQGDVYFWKGFTFDDGGTANKLLVAMGTRGDKARFLLKTTTKARHYHPDPDGCHFASSVYRFKQYSGGFKEPTWIQFDPPIFRFDADFVGAGAVCLFTLKDSDFRAIANCFRKSQECSPVLEAMIAAGC